MFHLLILTLFSLASADPPFLFPHGYFDSNKLKPFDAIYLNLMAGSNLEYGGTTLEELDILDASRKLNPRPTELIRNREEDDTTLDREVENKGDTADGEQKRESKIDTKLLPQNPFKRRFRDDAEERNPFEDIATRAPRLGMELQQLKRRLRRNKKSKKLKSKRIERIKSKEKPRPTAATVLPTLIPTTVIPAISRLPNNPFRSLDISQPNIILLPIPPEFKLRK